MFSYPCSIHSVVLSFTMVSNSKGTTHWMIRSSVRSHSITIVHMGECQSMVRLFGSKHPLVFFQFLAQLSQNIKFLRQERPLVAFRTPFVIGIVQDFSHAIFDLVHQVSIVMMMMVMIVMVVGTGGCIGWGCFHGSCCVTSGVRVRTSVRISASWWRSVLVVVVRHCNEGDFISCGSLLQQYRTTRFISITFVKNRVVFVCVVVVCWNGRIDQ